MRQKRRPQCSPRSIFIFNSMAALKVLRPVWLHREVFVLASASFTPGPNPDDFTLQPLWMTMHLCCCPQLRQQKFLLPITKNKVWHCAYTSPSFFLHRQPPQTLIGLSPRTVSTYAGTSSMKPLVGDTFCLFVITVPGKACWTGTLRARDTKGWKRPAARANDNEGHRSWKLPVAGADNSEGGWHPEKDGEQRITGSLHLWWSEVLPKPASSCQLQAARRATTWRELIAADIQSLHLWTKRAQSHWHSKPRGCSR